MSKIVTIFCEDDLQQRILTKLKSELTADIDIRLIKTDGKGGQKAFAKGFNERGGAVTPDFVFIFRDRDFDYPVSDSESLIEDKNTIISYRTTAENYLISILALQNYVNDKFSNTPVNIEQIMINAAKSISDYAAVRHALGFYRNNYSFKTTWTQGSGHLPSDLSGANCLNKGWKLIAEKQAILCSIRRENFEERRNNFLLKFDEIFFQSHQYLIWFNGKDLQKAIQHLLPFNLPWDRFEKEALKKFDFHVFPDLEQFFQKLNSL